MDKNVDSLSEEESDRNEEDNSQYSCLVQFIERGEIIEFKNKIKQMGNQMCNVRVNGIPLLHHAIIWNKYEIVEFLFSCHCSVSCYNSQKQSAVIIAAKVGNLNILNLCVKNGASLEDRDSKGMTPIHHAAIQGHIEVISYLIHQGSNLDVRDNKGRTPLMVAAQNNQVITVEWLLKHKCRILDQDSRGRCVLHWACSEGATDVVKVIIDSRYGPQLCKTVDFAMQTPIDLVKDLLRTAGPNQRVRLQRTNRLLHQFINHRVLYEMNQLFDRYLAFLFVPVLTLIGWFILTSFGLFTIISPRVSQAFSILSILILLLWLYLCMSDPGRIINNEGKLMDLQLNTDLRRCYEEIMKGEVFVMNSVCATCEIEKPERSKHCRKCNECVLKMDHHCRWINNCIGSNNHRLFLIFLFLCIVLVSFSFYILFLFAYNPNFKCPSSSASCYSYLVVFCLFYINLAWMGAYCVYLWVLQVYQISKNITTNETINWRHYAYLVDRNRQFHNPYDNGFFWNWMEFWGLTNDSGYGRVNVEEV